jgi:hypothetical protein
MKALLVATAMAAILVPMAAWAGDGGAWGTQVTGLSQAQCMQANQTCEARVMGQVGLTMGPVEVGVQCTPYYAQCMINATAASAPADMGSVTAMVVRDVDVYDAPGGTGKVIGMLTKHLEVTVPEPCVDNWCHVEGEGVPGGTGFVYSGPDFESLHFP